MLDRLPKISPTRLLSRLGTATEIPDDEVLQGFKRCQDLAFDAAKEIATILDEGWTEAETARLMNEYLRDHGVKSFFHKSFVWFGDRTRFRGVKNYTDYLPTKRVLQPGEPFILDVAPILHGYMCDIGYSDCLTEHHELAEAKQFLKKLRLEIPKIFTSGLAGDAVWEKIDQEIIAAGYENIHVKYPFGVLGHRVHRMPSENLSASMINFGWQSYWALLSRGLFNQLLNKDYSGSLSGLWAIEPHIGTPDFGAKFEEILVVDGDNAYWLAET